MNIKTLAIAAAAVMTAGAAQAADLGKPVKAAVDYVKVCDAYGAGFFYIPGSDTCVKLSGYVRVNIVGGSSTTYAPGLYSSTLNSTRTGDNYQTSTRAYLSVDARTNTDFGLLRSFYGMNFNQSGYGLDKAYIQWGGLTVGYAESFFTFWTGSTDELYYSELVQDYSTTLLAYTAAFGNGLTATLSLENAAVAGRKSTNGGTVAVIAAPGGSFTYQGNKAPDIVANLAVTQAWGKAAIAGIAHQVYGANTVLGYTGSKWGYGVLGGVQINLPMLGAGDSIALQGYYTSGFVQLAGENFTVGDIAVDAVFDTTGALKLTKTTGVEAGFTHNFTPNLAWSIQGGVVNFDGFGTLDMTEYALGTTLAWKPANGLQIKPSIEYRNDTFSSATKTAFAAQGLKDTSAWIVGVRFQRDF